MKRITFGFRSVQHYTQFTMVCAYKMILLSKIALNDYYSLDENTRTYEALLHLISSLNPILHT